MLHIISQLVLTLTDSGMSLEKSLDYVQSSYGLNKKQFNAIVNILGLDAKYLKVGTL